MTFACPKGELLVDSINLEPVWSEVEGQLGRSKEQPMLEEVARLHDPRQGVVLGASGIWGLRNSGPKKSWER